MGLGKRDKKELEELINGIKFDEEKDKKDGDTYDVGMACCDKDDMLDRVHPNKKL